MLQDLQSIAINIANHNKEDLEERLEEAIRKDLEGEEESEESEDSSSNSVKSESQITWKESCEFYIIFTLILIVGFYFLLVLSSTYVLYHSYNYIKLCPNSYLWLYVFIANTILNLINYSSFKYLHFVEHITDFRYAIPIIVLFNSLFSIWGYNSLHNTCVINNTYLSKLHQMGMYHFYCQIILSIAGIILFLILCTWNYRRIKYS